MVHGSVSGATSARNEVMEQSDETIIASRQFYVIAKCEWILHRPPRNTRTRGSQMDAVGFSDIHDGWPFIYTVVCLLSSFAFCTMVRHCMKLTHSIDGHTSLSHELGSKRVSEHASARMSQAERASKASCAEQANERVVRVNK